MLPEGLRLGAGADNKHVARIQAAVEAPVERKAIDQAPQSQSHGNQNHRAQNEIARNIDCAHQVERAGKQQVQK